jgi:hypothetical protein
MGGAGFVGVILDKLFPSAKERLEDARLRRLEDDDRIEHLERRIQELERERDEAKEKAYVEREARIAEKQQHASKMIELDLIRAKLGMANVTLPEDIEDDQPSSAAEMPHDDREGA